MCFWFVFSPHWTRPASANLVKKEVIFTLFFFSLGIMIKLFFTSRRTSPSLSGQEKERIYWAQSPAVACRAACHSARTSLPPTPVPSPPPPPSLLPLVLGSRFPPLTGKTYLEGGLKGLQTGSDRGCLAADVAGLMCHSAEGPERRGGGVEVWR